MSSCPNLEKKIRESKQFKVWFPCLAKNRCAAMRNKKKQLILVIKFKAEYKKGQYNVFITTKIQKGCIK